MQQYKIYVKKHLNINKTKIENKNKAKVKAIFVNNGKWQQWEGNVPCQWSSFCNGWIFV